MICASEIEQPDEQTVKPDASTVAHATRDTEAHDAVGVSDFVARINAVPGFAAERCAAWQRERATRRRTPSPSSLRYARRRP